MCPAERIPRALAGKFAAITALTDAFCEQQLNDEYRVLIHRVVETQDGRTPLLLIDGWEVSWEEFGRMLMTFEGWQFRMEIGDRSDEV
jgi:hypothetical protein